MFFRVRQPLAIHALCAMAGIIAADQLAAGTAGRLWAWAAGIAPVLWTLAAGLRWRRSEPRPPFSRAAALAACLATVFLFFAWHGFLITRGPGANLAARVPPQGLVVRAVGVVDAEPEERQRVPVRLESVTPGGEDPFANRAPVLVRWQGPLPRYGDRVQLTGDLHRLAPPRNPGVFDGPEYWKRQGITCELKVRYPGDVQILSAGHGSPFVARAYALRHWVERTLARDLENEPQLAGLIQSMVLGSRGESMEATKALFQATGTMHLFAVSGMNVAMLAAIAHGLLLALGLSRRWIAALVIPLLWVYCYATGLTQSSLRATVMATVFFAGVLAGRFSLSWNTLGAAALALVAWNPGTLFTAGFQLSFVMVALLLLFVPPLQRRLDTWAAPDPFLPRILWSPALKARTQALRIGSGALAVSTLAWIGSTPLMIHFFHFWSPASVPANILAAFLAWLMLIVGLASVLAGTVWQGLAVIFNNANWLIAKGLLIIISAIASIPFSHRYVELPSLRPEPLCEVEVLDLPGGAAAHLRVNGPVRRDWLLDCGSASAFSYTVEPYLRSRGVNRLDGLLLTHGDSQHVGGAEELFRAMAPKEMLDSPLRDRSSSRKAVHALLEAASQGKGIVSRGDVVTLAPGVALRVLFPPEGLEASRADDKAFVLRLDAGGRRILFTSDAGFRTETWLLENAPREELRADIWIKGAHPKDLSGIPAFVDAVSPSLLVASGAAFPVEERIDEAWAAGIETRGIRLLRQDRTGAVRITLDRQGRWQAEPFLTPPAAGK